MLNGSGDARRRRIGECIAAAVVVVLGALLLLQLTTPSRTPSAADAGQGQDSDTATVPSELRSGEETGSDVSSRDAAAMSSDAVPEPAVPARRAEASESVLAVIGSVPEAAGYRERDDALRTLGRDLPPEDC